MTKIVSNNTLASDLPAITTTAATQVYRNTDYKYFEPTLLVATNKHVSTTSLVHLTDSDATDSETTYAGSTSTYVKYLFAIGPLDTVWLEEKELKGLVFRYGVCALLDAANATGVEIYIAGKETAGA